MKLFVYGELCKPGVLRDLIGRLPAARTAVAVDRRRRRADSGWFELVPESGRRCAGLLLTALTEAEIERLDRFEGVDTGSYRRQPISVRTLGDRPEDLEASAYTAPVGSEL